MTLPSAPDAASASDPPRSDGTWALIAGGGTAGHVLPAVAIGRAMVDSGHPMGSIHFMGARRGLEARIVGEAGFEVTLLPVRGLPRRMTLSGAVESVTAVGALLRSCWEAFAVVQRTRPSVVVSVGGYASVPAVASAWLLGIPVVVAEQNAVPGAANRIGARLARAAAVSFAGTRLPRAELTGNPVRPEILQIDRGPGGRAAARSALGLPGEAKVLAVFGGSLGSLRINRATLGLAASWAARSDVAIRHVIGPRDWDDLADERLAASRLPADGLTYQQVRYEERMDLLYAAADVALCRAGASTVSELAAVGMPSVLVPLPGAPRDHQTANARAFEHAGAAIVVPDAEATSEHLARVLRDLLADEQRLAAMGSAARSLGHPDAAARVAEIAERHARG